MCVCMCTGAFIFMYINIHFLTKVSFQEESLSQRSPFKTGDAVVWVDVDAKLFIATRELLKPTFTCLNLLDQFLETAIP